ncbi:unnamed protein product [Owenia fusiformis]|uniref:Uncharacterized protein n=1 Tax=Owenia fusiformis TaxID=6347 RepID=A0A8S4N170_OWEFU|nr:unnamed protein product [Owenia fusiformis]
MYRKLKIFWTSLWIYILTWHLSVAEQLCDFPVEWQGLWFLQSQPVYIRQHTWGLAASQQEDSQAKCRKTEGPYYLLEQKRSDQPNCWKCIHVTPRHANVLQYKQSYCHPGRKTFHDLCYADIDPTSHLQTLVRDGGLPVPCPFEGAFLFSYNNNSGRCQDPLSSMMECSSRSQFQIEFKHCYGIDDTYDRVAGLQCLATWKDGTDDYMYTKMHGPGFTDTDNTYRCIRFHDLGTSAMRLAMSSDSTCFNMNDPTDEYMEDLEFDLTRNHIWPSAQCEYPQWIHRKIWRNIAGTKILQSDGSHSSLEVYHLVKPDGTLDDVIGKMKCISSFEEHERLFKFVSFTTTGCVSKFQCIVIHRRNHHVLEVEKSDLYNTREEAVHGCLHFTPQERTIIFNATSHGSPCPLIGRFDEENIFCSTTVKGRCPKNDSISIDTDCLGKEDVHWQCLAHWHHKKHQYFIVTNEGLKHQGQLANCLSLKHRRSGAIVDIETDNWCNDNAPSIMSTSIDYSLRLLGPECDPKVKANVVEPQETTYDESTGEATRLNVYSNLMVVTYLISVLIIIADLR